MVDDFARAPPAGAAAEELEEASYFSELLGYGADRLGREPELLAAEQERLRRGVQEAVAGRHGAFVAAAAAAAAARARLAAAAAALARLDADLPALAAAAERFRGEAAGAAARRAALRALAAQHAAVVDLLEAPALMGACARAGHYDEALDLRAFAAKLAAVHGELPAVRALAADAGAAAAAMRGALLARLEGPVPLPECLRLVGHLRRLGGLPEAALRAAFLARRGAWLDALAAELEERPAHEFLKRLTDVHRLHLFDVLMQHRAVFGDGDGDGDGDAALAGWAARRVGAYLAALRRHLPEVADGGALASVLDHAMHCGASLGRAGLDFRPVLAPPFEAAALALLRRGVGAADAALRALLEAHRWGGAGAVRARPAAADAPAEAADAPPAALLDHPPLAVYANGLLAALNELRHCAPLAIAGASAAALQASLVGAAGALVRASAARALGEAEAPAFGAARAALAGTLCPHVAACFGRVFAGGEALLDPGAVAAALEEGGPAEDAA